MNVLLLSLLVSAIVSGAIATARERSCLLWTILGAIIGPIAVAVLLCLPARKVHAELASAATSAPVRSLANEIWELEELRQRGLVTDDEFAQGKAQILAWPVTSPIPSALTPTRVRADGRRTWASYQPATRAAMIDLAGRHALHPVWRDDVPFELACTYPVQPGLSFAITLALAQGTVHCWGEGWTLDAVELRRPDIGLPDELQNGLEALLGGAGRLVLRTSYGTTTPFRTSLQVRRSAGWRTVLHQGALPWPPIWRRIVIRNEDVPDETPSHVADPDRATSG
jgi:hypothetical protein